MASKTLRVHIVDDDAAVRDALAFLLETEGWEVRTYKSAESLLETPPVDGCVITDLHMPGIGGFGLLREFKRLGIRVPVIAISGLADPAVARQVTELGAVRLIRKPALPGEIVTALRLALRD